MINTTLFRLGQIFWWEKLGLRAKSQRGFLLDYQRWCKEVEGKGLIVVQDRTLSLTPKGRRKLLAHYPCWRKMNAEWDGRWWLVGFDLAVVHRGKRFTWRRWLERLGFVRLQRSVWLSPWDWRKLLVSKWRHIIGQSPKLAELGIFRLGRVPRGLRLEWERAAAVETQYQKVVEAKTPGQAWRAFLQAAFADIFWPKAIDPLFTIRNQAILRLKAF